MQLLWIQKYFKRFLTKCLYLEKNPTWFRINLPETFHQSHVTWKEYSLQSQWKKKQSAKYLKMQSNILTTIDLDLTITYFNLQSDSTLTNSSDADTSIASCAYFVNRNTGVLSIFLHTDVKHTRATVTSKVAIKVKVMSMSIRVGICTTVKLHSSIMKRCSINWSSQQS